MRYASSLGVRIAYVEAGRDEPAVVLIHAPLGFRSQLAPQFDHLAARHRVIAIDLRGCGESDVPTDGFRIADYAEDVRAVCQAANVGRAVLVGHSLGGAVALLVALLEPATTAGVVLLDGAVLYPDAVRRQSLDNLVPALEGPGWLEALRGFFSSRMFGPYDPPAVKARVLEDLGSLPARMPAPLMRDGMSRDFAEELSSVAVPLMFVHAHVPADLVRLRQLRPDAIIASVAASGHFLSLVVPDQVNAMLDRFLAILPETAS